MKLFSQTFNEFDNIIIDTWCLILTIWAHKIKLVQDEFETLPFLTCRDTLIFSSYFFFYFLHMTFVWFFNVSSICLLNTLSHYRWSTYPFFHLFLSFLEDMTWKYFTESQSMHENRQLQPQAVTENARKRTSGK